MRKIQDHKILFRNHYPRRIQQLSLPFERRLLWRPPKDLPVSYFQKLFDNEIINNIIDYINTYALQCDPAKPIDVSVNELEQLFSCCFFIRLERKFLWFLILNALFSILFKLNCIDFEYNFKMHFSLYEIMI